MIKASEVRKMNDSVKDSEEFKFIMKKMEKDIKKAAERGQTKVEHTFYAMLDQHGEYPTQAMRKAVGDELCANGYVYWEFTCSAPNGNINSCYGIRW